jgi:hypothetical protein
MKLAAILLTLPTLAHAGGGYYDPPPQSQPHATDDDAFVFAAPSLGLGAPLGLLGIEFGVGLDALRLSGGAGIGLRGVQIGATGRAFTRMGGFDIGIGLGISRGAAWSPSSSNWDEDRDPQPAFAPETVWASLEIALEIPISRWSFTRFTAGVSYAASPTCEVDRPDMPDTPCDAFQASMLDGNERFLPYVGIASIVRFPEGPARQTFQLPQASGVPNM